MGFVIGRQTSGATRRILNIIQYAEKSQTSSLLLSIDTGKVFALALYVHCVVQVWFPGQDIVCHTATLLWE